MRKTGQQIAAFVQDLILPEVQRLGLELWDIRFQKEGGEDTLCVEVDKAGGVTLDDCENLARGINPILDEHDPIPGAYTLEVSSAGIERTLRREHQFFSSLGQRVQVGLYTALQGKKKLDGILKAYDNGTVSLETADGIIALQKEQYSAVKTMADEFIQE